MQVLEDWLINDSTSEEDLVIYWKKDGDYRWALSKEIDDPKAKQKLIQRAKQSYEAASRWAHNGKLYYHHPIKLELAISHADFLFHALDKPQQAIDIAKACFDEQIVELQTQTQDTYEKNILNLQCFKERLVQWHGWASNYNTNESLSQGVQAEKDFATKNTGQTEEISEKKSSLQTW